MAALKAAVRAVPVVVAIATPAGATAALAREPSSRDVELARDYVVASCITQRYPDTPFGREADAWAAGLVEAGHIAGTAYPRLAELARQEAPPALTSRRGEPMNLQSCLGLYKATTLLPRIRAILRGR